MRERIKLEQHEVNDGLIICSDFRFNKAIQRSIPIKRSDLLVVPGAAKKVLESRELLDDIALLTSLHNVRFWHIVDHQDCGYYKKRYGQDRYADEAERLHVKTLLEAKEKINQRLPKVKVVLFLAVVNQDGRLELKPILQK